MSNPTTEAAIKQAEDDTGRDRGPYRMTYQCASGKHEDCMGSRYDVTTNLLFQCECPHHVEPTTEQASEHTRTGNCFVDDPYFLTPCAEHQQRRGYCQSCPPCPACSKEAVGQPVESAKPSVAEQPAPAEDGSYAKVLHGTCALGYADCSLVEFAQGLKHFIEEESHKSNGDTGLIQTLQRAACIGWELARRGSEPIVSPIVVAKREEGDWAYQRALKMFPMWDWQDTREQVAAAFREIRQEGQSVQSMVAGEDGKAALLNLLDALDRHLVGHMGWFHHYPGYFDALITKPREMVAAIRMELNRRERGEVKK